MSKSIVVKNTITFSQTLAPILDAMCDWGTDYLK